MDILTPAIPSPGEWPVDPQEDVPMSEDRIWIDGCFDFSHHGITSITCRQDGLADSGGGCLGHAGAMLQARQLGKELIVGVHSDEEIMDNKGPTVMTLKERLGLLPSVLAVHTR